MTLASLHTREFESAFAFYKQSAIGTALAGANIDYKLPYRGFSPTKGEFPAAISDDDWYGRGTNFPTFWDPTQFLVRIPPREYSMTNVSAMFALAFVMGAVSSTQPNSASYGTVYDHEFTFQDTESNMDCNYTTIMEKAGDAWQDRISGVVLEQCTVSGNQGDHVLLQWQGFGRTRTSSSYPLPALTTGTSFFNFRRCTLSFGASGAAADVSDKMTAFTFTLNQNPNIRRNAGASAGEETLISRVVVGKQRISGSFTLDQLDSDLRDLFLDNNNCELTIVCYGDVISSTPYYHQLTISIPSFYIPDQPFGEDGDLTTITIALNEETVIKATGEDYCSLTVRTNIDDSQILATP